MAEPEESSLAQSRRFWVTVEGAAIDNGVARRSQNSNTVLTLFTNRDQEVSLGDGVVEVRQDLAGCSPEGLRSPGSACCKQFALTQGGYQVVYTTGEEVRLSSMYSASTPSAIAVPTASEDRAVQVQTLQQQQHQRRCKQTADE